MHDIIASVPLKMETFLLTACNSSNNLKLIGGENIWTMDCKYSHTNSYIITITAIIRDDHLIAGAWAACDCYNVYVYWSSQITQVNLLALMLPHQKKLLNVAKMTNYLMKVANLTKFHQVCWQNNIQCTSD